MDFSKREKFDPALHDFVPLPRWAIVVGFAVTGLLFAVAVVV